ncbi:hypothetical protein B0J17DRAFT_772164 [Rhizoctonia solani]|nr:hypothetical protein B0J17DRAFT_772164 [Rhizoctonia solani]
MNPNTPAASLIPAVPDSSLPQQNMVEDSSALLSGCKRLHPESSFEELNTSKPPKSLKSTSKNHSNTSCSRKRRRQAAEAGPAFDVEPSETNSQWANHPEKEGDDFYGSHNTDYVVDLLEQVINKIGAHQISSVVLDDTNTTKKA